jgi:hypothetical protein
MVRTSFVLLAGAVISNQLWASSPVALMWRKLSFENDAGAVVSLEVQGDVLTRVDLVLHGHEIHVPQSALNGVRLPVLRNSDLVYSTAVVGDRTETTASLYVPVLDETQDVQDATQSRRYQFIFENDRFDRRVLEIRHGTTWQIVELHEFKE